MNATRKGILVASAWGALLLAGCGGNEPAPAPRATPVRIEHVAQGPAHPVLLLFLDEEARQPVALQVAFDRRVVHAGARHRDGAFVDVGSEYLDRAFTLLPARLPVRLLGQQHRHRIRLLARRTGGHPGAQRLAGRPLAHQLRQDPAFERVEGFASAHAWSRAYAEINEFEEQLADHGSIVVKLWLATTKDEQLKRFKERERLAHKRFKITPDDWRNRKKWDDYIVAASDMIDRTSTAHAPWTVLEANDKHLARVRGCTHLVLEVAENNRRALGFYRKRNFFKLDASLFMAQKVDSEPELLPPTEL